MKKIIYKKSVLLGFFILLGMLMFAAGVLTISSQHKLFTRTVRVSAVFGDILGLQAGNNIWFSGVKVGAVKKVVFCGGNQVQVYMDIDKDARPYIHRDARARIGSDGLIGNRIVVIYGGADSAASLSEGDLLPGDSSLQTADMLATLKESNRNLLAVTGYFKEIGRKVDRGEGTLGSLVNDRRLVEGLQQTVARLDRAALNAVQLTAGVKVYAAGLNEPGGLAHELVYDTAVFAELKETIGRLRAVAAKASVIMDTLHGVADGLDDKSRPAGLLLRDKGVADDLRATIRNLRTGSEKLDQDLEALQHNFLLRGFFKKKK